jgi:glycine/D-amino acid oxidase-like deaminating enzyme
VDVAVVGHGVLGLSVALRLVLAGCRTALVGPRDRRWAASAAAGAMHGCFGEITATLLSSAAGRGKLDLDVQARAEWDPWIEQVSELADLGVPIRTAEGTTVMLNAVGTAELDTVNFRAILGALVEHGEPHEQLDGHAIDWIKPNPLHRPLQAVHIPGEHAVDAAALLASLEAAYSRAGGTLVDDLVARIVEDDDRIEELVLASGARIATPKVIVAAGAQSSGLLASVPALRGRVVPMVSGYGVSLLVEPQDGVTPGGVIRTPNRAFACGLHTLPRPDGRLYLGATNIISSEPRRTAAIGDVQFLLDCAVNQLHEGLAEAGIAAVQVGNRPVPADGFPIVGETPIDGLYALSGTYRDGLHQSPPLSALVTSLVLGRDEPRLDAVSDFAPVRPPICPTPREEVVRLTVDHMIATGVEHAWRLPPEWTPRMERHLRRFYSERVETWHPEFTPPPELVAAMGPETEREVLDYYAAWSEVRA